MYPGYLRAKSGYIVDKWSVYPRAPLGIPSVLFSLFLTISVEAIILAGSLIDSIERCLFAVIYCVLTWCLEQEEG